MIEYNSVMWDVVLDGIVIGYVEFVSGNYHATAPDGSTLETSTQGDAFGWLHQRAISNAQVIAPRRAGDRKGDIA